LGLKIHALGFSDVFTFFPESIHQEGALSRYLLKLTKDEEYLPALPN